MAGFCPSLRERFQENEALNLSPRAAQSSRSRGRMAPEEECPIRTPFQRDRDRIVHSKAFRRLKRKTQVFFAPLGDHFRTRMTHTLEVSQIGRTIARALRLNEDLVEAISLAHDLGHTPFGHAGESVLNRLLPEGFRHYIQSLRVVDHLERDGQGLNLTWEVRDGIIKHSKGMSEILSPRPEKSPATLEGEIVRLSDIIAYVNHDLDDALRAGLIADRDVPGPIIDALGQTHSQRINTLVCDVIHETEQVELERISISPAALEVITRLRTFLNERVYRHAIPQTEFVKAEKILMDLFGYLTRHPEGYLSERVRREESMERAATDFLAGMTDNYALHLYRTFFLPQEWTAGLNIPGI